MQFQCKLYNTVQQLCVFMKVNDLTEGPPVFTPVPTNFNVAEDLSVGSLLLTVTATEPDGAVEYTVTTAG